MKDSQFCTILGVLLFLVANTENNSLIAFAWTLLGMATIFAAGLAHRREQGDDE